MKIIVVTAFALLGFSSACGAQDYKVYHGDNAVGAFFSASDAHSVPSILVARFEGMIPGAGDPVEIDVNGSINIPFKKKRLAAGDILFLGEPVWVRENGFYSARIDPKVSDSIFGREVSLLLLPQHPYKYDTMRASLRAPLALVVRNDWNAVVPDSSGKFPVPNILSAGTVLSWNADSENHRNVFLSVTYDPRLPENESVRMHSPDWSAESSWMQVPDKGSVSLPAALFRSVPRGALVTLTLLRGNSTYFTGGEANTQKVAFSVYTCERGTFRYEKL